MTLRILPDLSLRCCNALADRRAQHEFGAAAYARRYKNEEPGRVATDAGSKRSQRSQEDRRNGHDSTS